MIDTENLPEVSYKLDLKIRRIRLKHNYIVSNNKEELLRAIRSVRDKIHNLKLEDDLEGLCVLLGDELNKHWKDENLDDFVKIYSPVEYQIAPGTYFFPNNKEGMRKRLTILNQMEEDLTT